VPLVIPCASANPLHQALTRLGTLFESIHLDDNNPKRTND
jgi:hypothetical protein